MYIFLIKNIFISCSKVKHVQKQQKENTVIVKGCFQPHVNVKKYYLSCAEKVNLKPFLLVIFRSFRNPIGQIAMESDYK